MEIINRIKQLLVAKGESINSLSKRLSLPQTSVNQWMSGGRKMPFEFVEKIVNEYPNLSADWLMRGKGPMFYGEQTEPIHHVEDPSTDIGMRYYRELLAKIEENTREIEQLKSKAI